MSEEVEAEGEVPEQEVGEVEAPAEDAGGEAPEQQPEDAQAGEALEDAPLDEANAGLAEDDQENKPQVPIATRLQRNPYYGQFLTALHNLISYEVKIYGQASPEAKQHLSDLIAALSGEFWATDERLSQGGVSQKRGSVSNASMTKRSHNQSKRGQSDPEFLSMVKCTQSDFSKIKGASFSKAPKFVDQKEKLPGPGDYNAEKPRPRSPGVVITQSERTGLFKVSDSPGPGSYYPMRHFVSK